MCVNRLILGDNLEILKTVGSETVDLIYLDPPFFSNRTYEVIWGDEGEVRSFQDRWAGGVDHYIAWLKERVEQMYRVLKPTGSMFLHCDWHANAYIRCYILDKIFGSNNFKNEIIWQRTRNPKGSQFEKRNLGIATDTIFWYAKTENYYFNEEAARDQLQNGELAKKYPDFDEKGRYYSGPVIRGASMGERPNLVYEYKGFTPEIYGWRMTKEKLIELDMAGNLGWSSNGKPFRKLRSENDKGNPIYNFWNDINRLYANSPENIGYPTQKPEKLLKRIIIMASKEGDLVLDPFMGGGTTIAVADKLNRRWTGIDQSVQAIKVTELRLDRQRDLFSAPFSVQLHKYDYDTLRYKDAFEFETWIVQQFGGSSNAKQRGDFGLDGKMDDNTPIQVKRSDNIGRNVIDNFLSAVKRADKKLYDKNIEDKKPVGYIIAFSFGKGAVQEAARLKLEENIIIRLVAVEEIVPIAKKPALNIEIAKSVRTEKEVWEIEFTAAGQSEAGIEFYSWDFAYNADKGFKPLVIRDLKGKQTAGLKAGLHNIAVKVVDNDGLENIEAIKLKINGTVERTN
ncbi:MAG: site-specific DNA-methyltransferase [Dysgonamonadaceae bacterium]|jgi:DNA modification methylase|nr:site-specific DNA-methyltransferase [Dysgonamonadaceae bacterium]